MAYNQNNESNQPPPSAFAVTLALLATFLGAPALYGLTEPYVTPILEQNYGYGFRDLYKLGWGCMTAALTYFLALTIIQFAVMMLATGILYRLF